MSAGAISLSPIVASSLSDPGKPTKLHQAAQQFEALVIGEMMRSEREADGDGWLGSSEESDSGSESATDIAETQFANALASRGGLGLASMIERTMGARQADQPVTLANPEAATERPR